MALGGMVLASVPVNAEGGAYLTFAFPIILFCVIASVLYVCCSADALGSCPRRALAGRAVQSRGGARAAVASGLPTAAGGP